nr:MAG TPA: YopX protein [Caudoviricetes sp.]
MKEILFRGKRVDNGDWVEGYYTELPCGSLGATIFSNDDELVCEDTKSYIIKVFTKQHTNYSNSNPLQVIECEKYEVIPETIGQFTGFTDKHSVKIFEGDIVDVSYDDGTAYLTEVRAYGNTLCVDVEGEDYEFTAVDFAVEQWRVDGCELRVISNVYDKDADA